MASYALKEELNLSTDLLVKREGGCGKLVDYVVPSSIRHASKNALKVVFSLLKGSSRRTTPRRWQ
jgi:hypothetical protein